MVTFKIDRIDLNEKESKEAKQYKHVEPKRGFTRGSQNVIAPISPLYLPGKLKEIEVQ